MELFTFTLFQLVRSSKHVSILNGANPSKFSLLFIHLQTEISIKLFLILENHRRKRIDMVRCSVELKESSYNRTQFESLKSIKKSKENKHLNYS